MNKKKLIFIIIIIGVVLLLLFFAIFVARSGSTDKSSKTKSTFKIWTFSLDKDTFKKFTDDFKKVSKNSNLTIENENFDNYEEYTLALASAFAKGEGPDLFMLNNNEKSLFLEQATGIDPKTISPDEVRKKFRGFFGDDLIMEYGEKDSKVEFLMGVPVGYEALGVLYNIQYIKNDKDLSNFSYIANLINKKSRDGLALIGIGGGSTVKNVSDIITQFFMGSGINKFDSISSSNIKKVLSDYFEYLVGDNNYGEINKNLLARQKDNIDAFIEGDIAAIFAYPRTVKYIEKKGFSKRLLRATNFPEFINESTYLVDYNYFVLNKNSKNKNISFSFLSYIFSEEGEEKFLEYFTYLLPARAGLYDDLQDDAISEKFYVKRKDFYNSTYYYASFDKGIKYIYDNNITNILETQENTENIMSNFIDSLTCKTKKILKLEDLSKNCD